MATARRPRRRANVLPVNLRVMVTCPLCGHRVPFDKFSEQLGDEGPMQPEFWRLWPRKPDGSRGFHWEQLQPEQLHAVEQSALERGHFQSIWQAALGKITRRMISWLDRHGIDEEGHRIAVGWTRLDSDERPLGP